MHLYTFVHNKVEHFTSIYFKHGTFDSEFFRSAKQRFIEWLSTIYQFHFFLVNPFCSAGTAKWIDEKEVELVNSGKPFNEALLGAAEEFAIECAMLKVYGSEMLDFVVDEGVQVHGGNGFSDEYIISKAYRDSRINRIYEGTNEINRLLTVDMVLKRAMKGRLDLMGPAMAVSKELMSIPDFSNDDETLFAKEKKYVQNFKKTILLVAGAAVQKLMLNLEKE